MRLGVLGESIVAQIAPAQTRWQSRANRGATLELLFKALMHCASAEPARYYFSKQVRVTKSSSVRTVRSCIYLIYLIFNDK